ncbi:MAG: hypothetical protein ACPLKS_07960 [Caldisericum exile]
MDVMWNSIYQFGTVFAYSKWKAVKNFEAVLPLQEKLARSTLKTEES